MYSWCAFLLHYFGFSLINSQKCSQYIPSTHFSRSSKKISLFAGITFNIKASNFQKICATRTREQRGQRTNQK